MADKKDNGWVIDLSSWRMKQVRAFSAASNAADFAGLYDLLLPVIKQWPLAQPMTVEGLDELTFAEWASLQEAVGEAFKAAFQKPKS